MKKKSFNVLINTRFILGACLMLIIICLQGCAPGSIKTVGMKVEGQAGWIVTDESSHRLSWQAIGDASEKIVFTIP